MTAELFSKYSRYIPDLLKIHNCSDLYDEIQSNINSIYEDTKTKKRRLLNQTDITEQYYDFQERIPLESIGDLYKRQGDSYGGFNRTKIASVTFTPLEFLDRIEEHHLYILSNLKDIRRLISKDLFVYQRLNRLYFRFEHDNILNLSDNNLFKYFFHFDTYDTTDDREGESLVVSLFLFLFLRPVYSGMLSNITRSFRFKCFTTSNPDDINIIEDELNIRSYEIDNEISSYFDDNNEVNTEFANFLANNIFVLNDPSQVFIDDLSSRFDNFFKSKVLNLFLKQPKSNTFQQTIVTKTMSSFTEYLLIKDIFNRSNFINISQENDIIKDENYIFQKITQLLKANQEFNLISLEHIIYQFREFPLYFLNSYPIAYNNYLNDILQNVDFIDSMNFIDIEENEDVEHIPNISDWINRINISNDDFLLNRDSIDIRSEFLNSKVLKYNFSEFFIDYILDIIDSDDFHQLIVVDLVDDIKDVSKYIPDYKSQIIDNVGRIKIFLKLFFIKALLDDKLFPVLQSRFQSTFDEEVEIEFPEQDLSSILSTSSKSVKKIYLKFIKGMFYSAHISSVLNRILDNYRL